MFLSLISGAPGVLHQSLENAFAEAGIAPRFAFLSQYTIARCALVAEGIGLAIVDPVPARELNGLPIVLRPFRPRLSIETMLVRPAGRPPANLAARLMELLKNERDMLLRC